ncbi:hypothetical protein GCM10017687_87060 [Streptomyces echinatus]
MRECTADRPGVRGVRHPPAPGGAGPPPVAQAGGQPADARPGARRDNPPPPTARFAVLAASAEALAHDLHLRRGWVKVGELSGPPHGVDLLALPLPRPSSGPAPR